jgi:blocked early in transport 1
VILLHSQNDTFSSMSSQLKGSASRLGRMAASGNKIAIFKLAAIIVVAFLILYYLTKWLFSSKA